MSFLIVLKNVVNISYGLLCNIVELFHDIKTVLLLFVIGIKEGQTDNIKTKNNAIRSFMIGTFKSFGETVKKDVSKLVKIDSKAAFCDLK